MAEFCSICEPECYDIDLTLIALDLAPGEAMEILCESCSIRAIYKDETGAIHLGRLINGKINLAPTQIEKL